MPAKYPPSQAKNKIRRSLRGLLDRPPTDSDVARLREHFGSRCAYCGVEVGVVEKDCHLDHLEAQGTNHISNRVLSCANCNEKEKRDRPWREFLREKAPSAEEAAERERHIELWVESERVEGAKFPPEVLRKVEEEIDAVIRRFDEAVSRIRSLRDSLREQDELDSAVRKE